MNPDSINLFITICDYDEEKYDDDDEKETRPVFNAVVPGLPRSALRASCLNKQ